MTRADLEAAAAEKYPFDITDPNRDHFYGFRRAAYIQGRLDQAEADAQIADRIGGKTNVPMGHYVANLIATTIEKGVE